MNQDIKISLITVCFNNISTIAQTIESVINQDYKNVEYIVIDGASIDGTQRIINGYKDHISVFVSEEDQGIYDAINKGISKATGDVIGLLHADDLFSEKSSLSLIAQRFAETECDACYADLQYVSKNDVNQVVRNWVSGEYNYGQFLKGWMPPHPTFYVRKACYDTLGTYDINFKISADYELMLRMIHKHEIKLSYIPKTLIKMRVGGASNKSLSNRLKANIEDRKAWKKNQVKPGLLTLWMKPLGKLGQFLRR